jgi:hypothetical protein
MCYATIPSPDRNRGTDHVLRGLGRGLLGSFPPDATAPLRSSVTIPSQATAVVAQAAKSFIDNWFQLQAEL